MPLTADDALTDLFFDWRVHLVLSRGKQVELGRQTMAEAFRLRRANRVRVVVGATRSMSAAHPDCHGPRRSAPVARGRAQGEKR